MPAIIAVLISALIQALRTYLPGLVGRVLLAFGIGFLTHTIAMPALKSYVAAKVAGLGAIGVAYWDATGLGMMVTMILSAIVAAKSQKVILSKITGSK